MLFLVKNLCVLENKTKQNSSVYNCYPLIDKRKMKSGSAIFSLLNKEIKNAFQTERDGKIEAIRKEIISGSKTVKRNVSVQNLTGEQTNQPMKPFRVNNECLIST